MEAFKQLNNLFYTMQTDPKKAKSEVKLLQESLKSHKDGENYSESKAFLTELKLQIQQTESLVSQIDYKNKLEKEKDFLDCQQMLETLEHVFSFFN